MRVFLTWPLNLVWAPFAALGFGILLGLVAVVSGCAPEIKTHEYKNLPPKLTIKRVPSWYIDTPCWGTKWDDGSYRKPGEHPAGCWEDGKHTAWIQDNCVGAEAIVHELGHADGVDEPSEDGYDW